MAAIDEFVNRIICGDCLEVMKQLPDESIDMILCDLPYGVTQNDWDSIIPLESLWACYERIIKDSGAIVLFAQQPFTSLLVMSNKKFFKYSWVWDKVAGRGFLNAKKQPLRRTEDICIFYRAQCTYNPQMQTVGRARHKGYPNKKQGRNYGEYKTKIAFNNTYYPTNLLQISGAIQTNKMHPTQKPLELFQYLILTYTNPRDIVLDNCCGSGTTGVACKNTSRNFIQIEKDPGYCKIAEDRLRQGVLF